MATLLSVPGAALGAELPSPGTYRPLPGSLATLCTGKACEATPFEGQIRVGGYQDSPFGSLGTLVTYVTFPLEEGDFDVVVGQVVSFEEVPWALFDRASERRPPVLDYQWLIEFEAIDRIVWSGHMLSPIDVTSRIGLDRIELELVPEPGESASLAVALAGVALVHRRASARTRSTPDRRR
jgi:hypothetical protein